MVFVFNFKSPFTRKKQHSTLNFTLTLIYLPVGMQSKTKGA